MFQWREGDMISATCTTHGSKYLLLKAREIKMITGCIINLTITPTWEGGQKKSYYTEGHETQPYSSQSSLITQRLTH